VLVVALECRYRHGLQRCDSLGTCRHVTQYVTKWVRGPVERLPKVRTGIAAKLSARRGTTRRCESVLGYVVLAKVMDPTLVSGVHPSQTL
jgi:hypothetical protein